MDHLSILDPLCTCYDARIAAYYSDMALHPIWPAVLYWSVISLILAAIMLRVFGGLIAWVTGPLVMMYFYHKRHSRHGH